MNLFSTKLKEFLDKAIKFNPIGSTFHIKVEPWAPCPFNVRDLEDQIRSVYGPINNYIFFGIEESGHYDAVTETGSNMRRESMGWIRPYLFGNKRLDEGEVPPEVLHWLENYKERHSGLINYIKTT
jgi:hypothetical protein